MVRRASAQLAVSAVDSRVIAASTRSTEPVLAAKFVNELAAIYVSRTASEGRGAAEDQTRRLTSKLESVRLDLERAEATLKEFGRSNGLSIVGTGAKTSATHRLEQLEQNLITARSQRVRWQAEAALAAEGDFPADLDKSTLGSYKLEVASSRRRRDELRQTYSASHYLAVQSEAQLAIAKPRSRENVHGSWRPFSRQRVPPSGNTS